LERKMILFSLVQVELNLHYDYCVNKMSSSLVIIQVESHTPIDVFADIIPRDYRHFITRMQRFKKLLFI